MSEIKHMRTCEGLKAKVDAEAEAIKQSLEALPKVENPKDSTNPGIPSYKELKDFLAKAKADKIRSVAAVPVTSESVLAGEASEADLSGEAALETEDFSEAKDSIDSSDSLDSLDSLYTPDSGGAAVLVNRESSNEAEDSSEEAEEAEGIKEILSPKEQSSEGDKDLDKDIYKRVKAKLEEQSSSVSESESSLESSENSEPLYNPFEDKAISEEVIYPLEDYAESYINALLSEAKKFLRWYCGEFGVKQVWRHEKQRDKQGLPLLNRDSKKNTFVYTLSLSSSEQNSTQMKIISFRQSSYPEAMLKSAYALGFSKSPFIQRAKIAIPESKLSELSENKKLFHSAMQKKIYEDYIKQAKSDYGIPKDLRDSRIFSIQEDLALL
jgi:hypothetical protein